MNSSKVVILRGVLPFILKTLISVVLLVSDSRCQSVLPLTPLASQALPTKSSICSGPLMTSFYRLVSLYCFDISAFRCLPIHLRFKLTLL